MGEPRLVLPVDPADEVVGEERRLRQLGGPVRLRDERVFGVAQVMSMIGEPRQPRLRGARQVEADLEAGQHALVVRQPRIVDVGDESRVDTLVGVAEQGRAVAGPLRHASDIVEPIIERRAVADDPIRHLVGARVEGGATRSAGCCLREVVGEPDAVGGERVEIRRPHDRVAGATRARRPGTGRG